MKELLYKKSEAVAALNRVDGFHPMQERLEKKGRRSSFIWM